LGKAYTYLRYGSALNCAAGRCSYCVQYPWWVVITSQFFIEVDVGLTCFPCPACLDGSCTPNRRSKEADSATMKICNANQSLDLPRTEAKRVVLMFWKMELMRIVTAFMVERPFLAIVRALGCTKGNFDFSMPHMKFGLNKATEFAWHFSAYGSCCCSSKQSSQQHRLDEIIYAMQNLIFGSELAKRHIKRSGLPSLSKMLRHWFLGSVQACGTEKWSSDTSTAAAHILVLEGRTLTALYLLVCCEYNWWFLQSISTPACPTEMVR